MYREAASLYVKDSVPASNLAVLSCWQETYIAGSATSAAREVDDQDARVARIKMSREIVPCGMKGRQEMYCPNS